VDQTIDLTIPTGRDIGRCPVVHVDPSPPMEAGSYWQQADELREKSPSFFNTAAQGYWIFTRHEQVREIYKQPDLFSSESFTPWEPEPVYRFIPTQIDPPEHIKYRQILNPWFSPGAVDRIEPTARAVCRRLIDELAPKGQCDFIADFALRYPTEVFLTMLGAPGADADLFVPWVDDFFKGLGGDPAYTEVMGSALEGIRNYWVEALAERRSDSEPRPGDLASHLLHATVDDRPLTDVEMLDMLTVLVLAGLDTTRGQLGYLFRHLALNPDDRARLVAEPALVTSAVEESLRLHTIIFGDGRKVTRDVDFHGCPLKQGDMVYALVAAANRDPRVFDHAGEFDVERSGSHHFGFAGGPHRCLGAHLARREMQIATAEWLKVIPDFRIAATEPLIERGGGAMNALLELPLAW
jgi:cytochrome P450